MVRSLVLDNTNLVGSTPTLSVTKAKIVDELIGDNRHKCRTCKKPIDNREEHWFGFVPKPNVKDSDPVEYGHWHIGCQPWPT